MAHVLLEPRLSEYDRREHVPSAASLLKSAQSLSIWKEGGHDREKGSLGFEGRMGYEKNTKIE